jgi:predicted PurR-regulated permease PerM
MGNYPNSQESVSSNNGGWLSRERALAFVLVIATAIAFYICYQIALPFIPAIIWSIALAVIAYPLHNQILSRIKRPTISAFFVVLIVAVIILGPGIFLGQTLISQIGKQAETIKSQTALEQWQSVVDNNPKLARITTFIEPHFDVRSVAERAASAASSVVATFVGGLVWVGVQFVITFFTLFYLFRDKRLIVKKVKSLMPFSQSEADKLFSRISDTIYATIYGTFAVSLVQGILGGLMFWWLDLPSPLLWGIAMFLLSLIPVLGAPVVWIPAAIFLALTGDWGKALILAGWGVLVIGSIDNLLYPVLVGDKLRLHPLLVFFSVIGGVSLIGSAGLVLGPVTVAITGMLIEIWMHRTSDGGVVEDGIYG